MMDDPPDHIEERARRIEKDIMVSRQRQRSASAMSTLSSMPSVSETNVADDSYSEFHQFLQRDALMHKKLPPKPRKQNSLNNGNEKKPQRAMSAMQPTAGSRPLPSDKTLWRSYNDLHQVNEEDAFVRRSRQLSPHPADIIKGQAHADVAELHENNDSMQDGSSDEIPNLSDNTLGPSDAMQLQKLIEQMQHEFQRLRTAKMQAEAKAQELQTDLSTQQLANESLSKENERLKVAVNESQTILGKLGGKAKQIDNEHKMLKKEYAKLKQKKEVGEAQLVAAELRASAAEQENIKMRNKVKQLARFIPVRQQEGRKHETSLLI